MSNSTPNWLGTAISDLANVEADGNLAEVLAIFNSECRPIPPLAERQRQTRQHVRANEIARAAAHLLGRPVAECERVAHDVLTVDPWAEQALRIIREFKTEAAIDDRSPIEKIQDAYQRHGLDGLLDVPGGSMDPSENLHKGSDDAAERALRRLRREGAA